jgi:predicted nucleic acid-binding protein
MICVDASLAVKLVVPEEYSPEVSAMFAACVREGEAVYAPTLVAFEVTNIVRKKMLREGLGWSDAIARLSDFFALPIQLRTSHDLHLDALEIAERFRMAATYDAEYVALAQNIGCDLWTDDRVLLREVGNRLPFVRWIGDYTPGDSL